MSKKYFIFLLLAFLAIGAIKTYCGNSAFDPQKLVNNSQLGGQNFHTKVEEIVSPKYKIKAYLFEENSNPIISLNFTFAHAGQSADKKGEEGVANLAAAMLAEGTQKLASSDFKEQLENLAVSLSYAADRDDFSGSLLTTKKYAAPAFALLKDTLMAPRLAEEDLQRVKIETLNALKSQRENPQSRLALAAAAKIYGNHPYGRNPIGETEAIRGANADKIRRFLRENLGKDNLIVGIAGDISSQEAATMLDDVFGDLPSKGAADITPPAQIDFTAPETNINETWAQTMAYLAAPGAERRSEDFYPLYIANYILGGSGLTSRLNVAAREKEGLTYGIYTGLSLADKANLIAGSYSSTPQNFARVKEIIQEEWKKLAVNGVSAAELAEAKNYLTSSYNLRFADITTLSAMLAYMQKASLGIDFLEKRNQYVTNVTLEEVNQAAKKYFKPGNLLMINLGNFNSD